jgi:hypothetical protein
VLEARDPVRLDSAQIGGDEDLRDVVGVAPRDSDRLERGGDERAFRRLVGADGGGLFTDHGRTILNF